MEIFGLNLSEIVRDPYETLKVSSNVNSNDKILKLSRADSIKIRKEYVLILMMLVPITVFSILQAQKNNEFLSSLNVRGNETFITEFRSSLEQGTFEVDLINEKMLRYTENGNRILKNIFEGLKMPPKTNPIYRHEEIERVRLNIDLFATSGLYLYNPEDKSSIFKRKNDNVFILNQELKHSLFASPIFKKVFPDASTTDYLQNLLNFIKKTHNLEVDRIGDNIRFNLLSLEGGYNLEKLMSKIPFYKVENIFDKKIVILRLNDKHYRILANAEEYSKYLKTTNKIEIKPSMLYIASIASNDPQRRSQLTDLNITINKLLENRRYENSLKNDSNSSNIIAKLKPRKLPAGTIKILLNGYLAYLNNIIEKYKDSKTSFRIDIAFNEKIEYDILVKDIFSPIDAN